MARRPGRHDGENAGLRRTAARVHGRAGCFELRSQGVSDHDGQCECETGRVPEWYARSVSYGAPDGGGHQLQAVRAATGTRIRCRPATMAGYELRGNATAAPGAVVITKTRQH